MGREIDDIAKKFWYDKALKSSKSRSIATTVNATKLLLILFMAMVYLGPLMSFKETVEYDGGNFIRQIIYLMILLSILYIMYTENKMKYLIKFPPLIVVSLVWCLISVFWAINEEASFRRLFLTIDIIMSVFIFCRILNHDELNRTIKLSLIFILIINYVAVIFFPSIGIHAGAGDNTSYGQNWRGVMSHKNFAGVSCSFLILYTLFGARNSKFTFDIILIFLSAFFLFESQSKTSAGVVVLSVLAGYAFALLAGKLRIFMVVGLAIASLSAAIIGMVYSSDITGGLLHPRSFTGRGQIWAAVLRYCQDNPWLGTGFGSFWNIGYDSPIYHYTTGFATTVTVGHNGYLDLAATVGIPGMVLIVISTIAIPFFKLVTDSTINKSLGSLFISVLVFSVGHNVTESSIFDRDAIVGVFLIFTIAGIYQQSGGFIRKSKTDIGDELVRSINRSRQMVGDEGNN